MSADASKSENMKHRPGNAGSAAANTGVVTPGTKVRTKVHIASVGLDLPAGLTGTVYAVLRDTSWPYQVAIDGRISHVYFARDELETIE